MSWGNNNNGWGQGFNNPNQGFNNPNQGFNQGFNNQGFNNQGFNQGFNPNQGFDQGFNNQGFNQGFNPNQGFNQGFNNQGFNPNQGFNQGGWGNNIMPSWQNPFGLKIPFVVFNSGCRGCHGSGIMVRRGMSIPCRKCYRVARVCTRCYSTGIRFKNGKQCRKCNGGHGKRRNTSSSSSSD